MKTNDARPLVVVTMGDPAGVGPEICAGCMTDGDILKQVRPVVIGDRGILQRALDLQGSKFQIHPVRSPEEGGYQFGSIDLMETDHGVTEEIVFGSPSVPAAKMAYSFILKAIELGKQGSTDVITTCPINKEYFVRAGFGEKDHTALFRKHFGGVPTVSMFHCRELRVFHYTRHMSLKNAIAALDVDKLVECMKGIHTTLRGIGIASPRIAVAALNPHASDHGLFGDEEEKFLIPAIRKCVEMGIRAEGPVPSDSVFYLEKRGVYDGVLSLFHDQGHIACKTYDFEKSVSLTFGFPFMRSTVDHGTAYDIAGKNTASYENLKEAILMGAKYWKMQQPE